MISISPEHSRLTLALQDAISEMFSERNEAECSRLRRENEDMRITLTITRGPKIMVAGSGK